MSWTEPYIIFLLFIMFSFLGWAQETIIVFIETKKWTDRGFLTGPFCPIYGTGVAVICIFLAPYRHNILLLFSLGMILTTFLEYITSVIMELIFKTRWWDYSTRKFNLNGRIALLPALFWGVLSTVVVGFVYDPLVNFITTKLPFRLTAILLTIISVVMVIDFCVSAYNAFGITKILSELNHIKDEIKNEIKSHANVPSVQDVIASIKEKYSKKLSSSNFFQKRLLRAFPQIRSASYSTALEELKARIKKA